RARLLCSACAAALCAAPAADPNTRHCLPHAHAPLADAICAPPVTACFDPLVPGAQRWHSGSMCGRYVSFREAQALADAFDVEEITDAARELPASYNVAPTEQVRIVVDRVPKAQRP